MKLTISQIRQINDSVNSLVSIADSLKVLCENMRSFQLSMEDQLSGLEKAMQRQSVDVDEKHWTLRADIKEVKDGL